MNEIKSILVLSKTTKYCQNAVSQGILLARKHAAELCVVHSIHDPFGLERWNLPLVSLRDLEQQYKQMQEDARRDLDEMIEKEAARGLPIEVIVSEAEMVQEVLNIVEEKKIDLLIVRTHQEGRLEHFLFDRDNEELIRKLPCSILLLKDEPKAIEF